MRDRLDDLGDPWVAVITFSDPDLLPAYRRHLDLPFPVLTDPSRDTYRRYGLGRGSVRQVYGLGTLRLYARLLARGRRLRRPTEDTLQLGADVVIDADGRVAEAFLPDAPDDRPGLDDLVAALDRARGGPGP